MKRQNKKRLIAAALAGIPALFITQTGVGQTIIWTGNDGPLWNDTLNWNPTTVPGSGVTAEFAGTNTSNNNISLNGGTQAIGTILFDSTTATFDLGTASGDTFIFDPNGAITLNSDVTTAQTIGAAIQTTGALTITNNDNNSGGLTLGGNVAMSQGGLLTIGTTVGASTTQFNGNITDGGGSNVGSLALVALGTASGNSINFIFNGTNTYSGTTSITVNTGTGGSIQIGSDSPFGTSKVTVNLVAGTSSPIFQALNGTRTISNAMDLNGGLTFIGSNGFNFNGPINVICGTNTSRTLNLAASGVVTTFGATGSASTITLGNPVSNGGDGVGKTLLINAATGSMIVINDNMQDPGTGGGTSGGNVQPQGGGTILFGGQSTYSGTTTIVSGGSIIQVGSSSVMSGSTIASGPFGVGSFVFSDSTNSPVEAVGGDRTIANPVTLVTGFTIQNAPSNGINANTSGNLTFTGAFNVNSSTTRTLVFNTPGKTVTLGASPNATTFTLNPISATTNSIGITIAVATGATLVMNDIIQDSATPPAAPDTFGYNSFGTAPANGFGTVLFNAASTYAGMTTFSGGSTNTTAGTFQFGVSSVGSGTGIISGPIGRGTFEPSNQAAPPIFEAVGADRVVANAMIINPSGFFVLNAPGTPYNLSFTGPIAMTAGRTITNNMGTATAFSLGAPGTSASTLLLAGTANVQLVLQTQISGGGSTIINDLISDTATSRGNIIFQNNVPVQLTNPNNSFTGGIAVNSSAVLTVSADGNLGAATGTVSINAGTLLSAGSFSSARNITLSGTNTDTIDATGTNVLTLTGTLGGVDALTKGTNSGTLQLGQSGGYTTTNSVNVNGGVLLLGPTGGETNPFAIGNTLTINNGGVASVAAGVSSNSVTNTATSLTINGSGQLNLANSTLVTTTPSNTIRQYLIAGYNGGASNGGGWNGTGGISSVNAAASTNHLTALGYSSGTHSALGIALGLASNQTVVKYTIYGDANLDGSVDISDLDVVLSNYASGKPPTWDTGDFTYAGQTDITDLNIVLSNYAKTAPATVATPSVATPSAARPSVKAAAGTSSGPQTLTGTVSPAVASGAIELDVNTITGDAVLNPNNVKVVSLQVASSSGNLIPNNWKDLSFYYGTTHWADSSFQTINLAEYDTAYTSRHDSLTLTAPVDYGDIFNTSGPHDLTFEYGVPDADGSDVDTEVGVVVYSGVPEPTTLGLMGLAMAGLMGRRRRKTARISRCQQALR